MFGAYVKNAAGEELAGNWSGHGQKNPPAIGDQIKVSMNGLGDGKVVDFFVAKGSSGNWLGVKVKLDNPPKWFIANCNGNIEPAEVFGAEIKY